MPSPEILYVIVCDDIRTEDTGKFLVIGMYTDTMIMDGFPQEIDLVFMPHVRVPAPGRYEIEMCIINEAGSQPELRNNLRFTASEASHRSGLVLRPARLKIEHPGDIIFLAGADRKEMLRLPIIAGDPPNVLPPPFEQSQPASLEL